MAKQKKRWSTSRKVITWLVSIIVVLIVLVVAAGGYFFHVAEVRAKKEPNKALEIARIFLSINAKSEVHYVTKNKT